MGKNLGHFLYQSAHRKEISLVCGTNGHILTLHSDMDTGISNGLLFACQDKNIRQMSIRNTSGDPLGPLNS